MRNNQNHDLNNLIKEALRDEMESIEPSISSNQAWEKFNFNQNKKTRRRFMPLLTNKKVLYPLLSLMIFITLLTVTPYNGSAFSKIFNFFNSVQGDVTHLFVKSSDSKDHADPPTQDDYKVVEGSEVVSVSMSLEEAKRTASFTIGTPEWLPKGYQLEDVIVLTTDKKESNEVNLLYMDHQKEITIRQLATASTFGLGVTLDNDDSNFKEVMINGYQGNLISHKTDYMELIWTTQEQYFTIEGFLSEKEILKIAESM